MTYLIETFHHFARKLGFDFYRYPTSLDEMENLRQKLLRQHKINLILDVGANTGQYAKEIRRIGYDKKIISFEPLSVVFDGLSECAASDSNWLCKKVAIGEEEKETEIHVAGNLQSSSLLPMCNRHTEALPSSAYIRTEAVSVSRMDSFYGDLIYSSDLIWLKLDVQGYELNVLNGATKTLPYVQVIETELSLVALYENQPLICDMISVLGELQFDLVGTRNVFSDPATGHVLQVDGLFVRRNNE